MTSFKKTIVVMSLACFISTGLFFAFPRQAKAQFVVSNPDIMGVMVKESVGKSIDIVIMETASMALVNAMNYFFQKLAYDAAVWVAAGGSGQKPLFDNKSPGEYFKNVASNTFGTFIDDISKMTQSKLGFDLCQPSLSVLLKIKIGLLRGYGPPQEPTCNFQKFVDNWDEFTGSFATGEVLKNVGVMFEPGQNDLSYTFELNTAMLARQDEVKYEKALELSNNKGWQDVKDVITGRIKTPAAVVKETFSENYTKGPSGQIQITNNAFAQAIAAGGKQVLGSAISMFANTLLSQTMEKLMGGFFLGDLLDDEDAKDSVLTGGASSAGPAVGRRKAQEVYGGFIKPSIGEVTNYDPLIEFTTCPTKETEKSINNCVLDNSFASAIRLASQGAPISIDEAIKQGYLDGNKPLISSKDSRNEEKDCYQKGYCYSNLVKLRKARILPVGFELAAEVGAEQGAPPKLDTIVKAFNDCDPNTNARSSKYPYCHLIDPNWVLRLPATQCKAQVYGPTLISTEGPKRAQECADPITCISEDENGKCVGGWGYCTKEKNIWKIPADKCPEQYNTCMAYKPRTSKTNVTENYLKNTVRFDSCVASNAGCRPYSVSKNSGVWSGLIGDEIFFNKDVEKCESKNAG
ncbi:hypothetical protein KJ885_02090, partial [Patescibacteria group bacterium]|nr:hypothetical protein [Patescibacteria group bacterium]